MADLDLGDLLRKGGFQSCSEDAFDFRSGTHHLVDIQVNILHQDQEVVYIPTCYLLLFATCRVFGDEELSSYRRVTADITTWWHDDGCYYGETVVRRFMSFFFLSKTDHDSFFISIMAAASVFGTGSYQPVKPSVFMLIFLTLLSISPLMMPTFKSEFGKYCEYTLTR